MNKRFVGVVLSVMALSGMQGADTPKPPQPQVGQPAPDFSLSSVEGRPVSLKDYKGKWVVLYFYPKDFTTGCTLEARNFERDLAKYQNESAIILGVSADTAQSHKDFCTKEGLNFKLLADPELKATTQYGSAMEHGGGKVAAGKKATSHALPRPCAQAERRSCSGSESPKDSRSWISDAAMAPRHCPRPNLERTCWGSISRATWSRPGIIEPTSRA